MNTLQRSLAAIAVAAVLILIFGVALPAFGRAERRAINERIMRAQVACRTLLSQVETKRDSLEILRDNLEWGGSSCVVVLATEVKP